ncbi:hypothetical protein [Georgenia sp. SUBG003]|uniref:hypothetical protein n=1 Tax=Georgenia sp. SUBG003 TaxID=1497974 RepID=UPI003AB689DA
MRLTKDATERSGRPKTILAIILVSYFMILLDNSVVFTGLPSIRTDLGLTTAALSWVQDAYTLVFGGLLLLGARAATWSAPAVRDRPGDLRGCLAAHRPGSDRIVVGGIARLQGIGAGPVRQTQPRRAPGSTLAYSHRGISHATLLVRSYAALLQRARPWMSRTPCGTRTGRCSGYFNSLRVLGRLLHAGHRRRP